MLLAVVEAIPEVSLMGVGTGNFWGQWGMWSGFYSEFKGRGTIVGAHNAYLQILIYWVSAP